MPIWMRKFHIQKINEHNKKQQEIIDKQIIEYEISNLYLNTITDGEKGFIKKINLELAW
jgi:hypothetical protein